MAEKKDKYLQWVEQGKLRIKLNATHILVKCDVKEADIAKYLDITVKQYRELKQKYPEFNKAADPKDPSELVEMVTVLKEIGIGYVRTTQPGTITLHYKWPAHGKWLLYIPIGWTGA